jgi:hypothetical protein
MHRNDLVLLATAEVLLDQLKDYLDAAHVASPPGDARWNLELAAQKACDLRDTLAQLGSTSERELRWGETHQAMHDLLAQGTGDPHELDYLPLAVVAQRVQAERELSCC